MDVLFVFVAVGVIIPLMIWAKRHSDASQELAVGRLFLGWLLLGKTIDAVTEELPHQRTVARAERPDIRFGVSIPATKQSVIRGGTGVPGARRVVVENEPSRGLGGLAGMARDTTPLAFTVTT